MTDEQRRAILQEIVELSGFRQRQPHEITIADYANETGMSDVAARGKLMALVKDGVLGTAMAMDAGRSKRVFWKIET